MSILKNILNLKKSIASPLWKYKTLLLNRFLIDTGILATEKGKDYWVGSVTFVQVRCARI